MAVGVGYVILNGKRYTTSERSFTAPRKKSQQLNVSIGKKTISQDFGYKARRWEMKILVAYSATTPYGSFTDLETAYDLAFCSFTDIFGVSQGTVYFEGELIEAPAFALVDAAAPFEVTINLRKRDT